MSEQANVTYRAVRGRCAINLDAYQFPIPNDAAVDILKRLGFRELKLDLATIARSRVGKSEYYLRAKPSQAPEIVNCSSFVRWAYGLLGVWLPRFAIQQRAAGYPIPLNNLRTGDLLFSSGSHPLYEHDSSDGVGHVAMVISKTHAIHAASKKMGVCEIPTRRIIQSPKFRGARRIIPPKDDVRVLEIPQTHEIETPDDIRWIILQNLPKEASK